jgi:Mrp family chromosome partitioning ATPase
MSRNFELLQNLGTARQSLGVAASAETADAVPAEAPPAQKIAAVSQTAGGAWHPEMHRLVQNIFFAPQGMMPKLVAFQPVERVGGAEFVCARAAEVVATTTTSPVCVIDLNVVEPQLHAYFGISNENGVSDALLRGLPLENFGVVSPITNLTVIPAGPRPAQGYGLLSPASITSLFQSLRHSFEYVLVNVPPVEEGAFGALLASLTDGAVLILEMNTTRRELARRGKEELHRSKANILGAVLNNRTFPIPQRIYERLA